MRADSDAGVWRGDRAEAGGQALLEPGLYGQAQPVAENRRSEALQQARARVANLEHLVERLQEELAAARAHQLEEREPASAAPAGPDEPVPEQGPKPEPEPLEPAVETTPAAPPSETVEETGGEEDELLSALESWGAGPGSDAAQPEAPSAEDIQFVPESEAEQEEGELDLAAALESWGSDTEAAEETVSEDSAEEEDASAAAGALEQPPDAEAVADETVPAETEAPAEEAEPGETPKMGPEPEQAASEPVQPMERPSGAASLREWSAQRARQGEKPEQRRSGGGKQAMVEALEKFMGRQ